MVYEILATTPFGKEKKGEVGIERMVDEGAYSGAFPLHDVSKMKNSMIEGQKIGQNIKFFGQQRMVDEGAYSGAFLLHEVSKMKNSMIEAKKLAKT